VPVRILVAKDHPLFRDALTSLLRRDLPEIDIDECTDLPQLRRACDRLPLPDLLLVDLGLPGGDTREVLVELLRLHDELPIVVISANQDPGVIDDLIGRGIRGYIPKTTAPSIMTGAIKLVLSGGTYLPPELLDRTPAQPAAPVPGLARLTPRQQGVLALLAEGCANKEIAARLDISVATVKLHFNAVLKALEVTNRTAAALRYRELRTQTPPGAPAACGPEEPTA